ncbi:MAG: EAL domain-containing protein [Gammaproteobacteria bacterium]|nr:EAL domain-containing protein [Gammaproteobacteria bacterium]MBQ0838839.1 EAL domain-containing protein [Gammaproteobacteria bacterium]
MTLFRQFLIVLLIAVALLYLGNIAVAAHNNKTLVEKQMRTHAEDTATSIALSMTQAASNEDIATLETILNAVSDNGFYQRIYFRGIDKKLLIDRYFPLRVESVPPWFIRVVQLPVYEGSAEVTTDLFQRLGTLVVVSHPGQAYLNLWTVLVEQLIWFSLVAIITYVLISLAIRRLLIPLKRLENQANAICRQDFVQQQNIPRTRELATLVKAMNRMSLQVSQLFQRQLDLISELRQKTRRDELTGLGNRSDFDARLNAFVDVESGSHCGVLMILAVRHLGQLNQHSGRTEGNNLLKSVASCLSTSLQHYEQALIARRQGCEFAIFISDIERIDALSIAQSLFADVQQLSWFQDPQQHLPSISPILQMGYTYSDCVSNGPLLLREADMALGSMADNASSQWQQFSHIESPTSSVLNIDWPRFVSEAISKKKILLNIQAVYSVPERNILSYEVFSSFPDENQGSVFSARTVLPALERAGLGPEFDQLVLGELLHKWQGRNEPLNVNISLSSLKSASFRHWLAKFLAQNRDFASLLSCELPERVLHLAEHEVRRFEALLSQYGAGLAIDGFGLGSSKFAYLGSLPLRYLKVHRSFTRDIDGEQDNQFYIRSLVQLASIRSLPLIAEGVESETEWQLLMELGVSGAQGYYLAELETLE